MKLWIREKWKSLGAYPDNAQVSIEYAAGGRSHFETTDWAKYMMLDTNWRSTLFMPRWSSRITLEILRVGVQRVQEISEGDAIAEGCQSHYCSPEDTASCKPGTTARELAEILEGGFLTAKNDFSYRWRKINGKKHPWASNPWVWIIEFKVVTS